MNWLKIPAWVKYFLGILLIQAVTALLVYAAVKNNSTEDQLLFALVGTALGLLGALWFSSIAGGDRKEALARVSERLSKEREKFRVQAEKEKNKIREQTQKQASKIGGLTQSKSNFKVGASTLGLVGIGGVLLVTQFVTMGMLVMGVSGGVLAGYLWRVRQEQKKRSHEGDNGLLPTRWRQRLPAGSSGEASENNRTLKMIRGKE
ncbi:MAG: hypothetical protein KDI63_07775 [Gammaproteobacteria bacterium]|nr:hypothetical protein [Gammaproteobacteria bacterium]